VPLSPSASITNASPMSYSIHRRQPRLMRRACIAKRMPPRIIGARRSARRLVTPAGLRSVSLNGFWARSLIARAVAIEITRLNQSRPTGLPEIPICGAGSWLLCRKLPLTQNSADDAECCDPACAAMKLEAAVETLRFWLEAPSALARAPGPESESF